MLETVRSRRRFGAAVVLLLPSESTALDCVEFTRGRLLTHTRCVRSQSASQEGTISGSSAIKSSSKPLPTWSTTTTTRPRPPPPHRHQLARHSLPHNTSPCYESQPPCKNDSRCSTGERSNSRRILRNCRSSWTARGTRGGKLRRAGPVRRHRESSPRARQSEGGARQLGAFRRNVSPPLQTLSKAKGEGVDTRVQP